jgi:hypothetical protein
VWRSPPTRSAPEVPSQAYAPCISAVPRHRRQLLSPTWNARRSAKAPGRLTAAFGNTRATLTPGVRLATAQHVGDPPPGKRRNCSGPHEAARALDVPLQVHGAGRLCRRNRRAGDVQGQCDHYGPYHRRQVPSDDNAAWGNLATSAIGIKRCGSRWLIDAFTADASLAFPLVTEPMEAGHLGLLRVSSGKSRTRCEPTHKFRKLANPSR